MDEARLRRLQLAQGRLSSVSRCANGFLRTLSLRDVGIDQYEAAARHRITARLDDTAIRSRTLDAQLLPGIFVGATQISFEIGGVLAAIHEIAEIVGVTRPLDEEGIGQIKDRLEVA